MSQEDREINELKKRESLKGSPFYKVKSFLKTSPTLILLIIIFVILAGGYYFISEGAKESMLSKTEKTTLSQIVSGNISVQDISTTDRSLLLTKLNKDSELNRNLIMFLIGLIVVSWILFMWRASTDEGYIGMGEAKAIVEIDMRRVQRMELRRNPDFDFTLEMACRLRWWGSQALGNEPLPFMWSVLVNIKKDGQWNKYLYILDPRVHPQIHDHIFGIIDVPEGWRGVEWKNLDFVPYGMPQFFQDMTAK